MTGYIHISKTLDHVPITERISPQLTNKWPRIKILEHRARLGSADSYSRFGNRRGTGTGTMTDRASGHELVVTVERRRTDRQRRGKRERRSPQSSIVASTISRSNRFGRCRRQVRDRRLRAPGAWAAGVGRVSAALAASQEGRVEASRGLWNAEGGGEPKGWVESSGALLCWLPVWLLLCASVTRSCGAFSSSHWEFGTATRRVFFSLRYFPHYFEKIRYDVEMGDRNNLGNYWLRVHFSFFLGQSVLLGMQFQLRIRPRFEGQF
jgi:hypothetical protein